MKLGSVKTLRLVLGIILLIALIVGIFAFLANKESSEDDYVNNYYVSSKVEINGTEVSGGEATDLFGTKSKGEILSFYFKDTGDCGICLLGECKSGVWKEKDNSIVISYGDNKKINLEKSWSKFRYTISNDNASLEITLEQRAKTPTCFEENPDATFGVYYKTEDTQNLSNFMLDGYYVENGGKLYGKFFDGDKSVLGAWDINESDKTQASDVQILSSEGQAKFLSVNDGYLYYLSIPNEGITESICRRSLEDGEEEVLLEGDFDYLQVRYNKIYYADENYRFCAIDLDGKNQETLIDKEVYLPYVIDKNWVIYQDDADGETLHLATLDGVYEKKITDERTYSWTISGRNLYYASTSDKEDEAKHKCKLHKLALRSLKTLDADTVPEAEAASGYTGDTFAICESTIYAGNGDGMSLDEWGSFSNDLYEDNSQSEYLLYVSSKYNIVGVVNDLFEFKEITLVNNSNGESSGLI